jgi:hypothetical protein
MLRVALTVGLLAGASAFAACKADGLLVFPTPGSVIPTNSRFILEGAGKEKGRLERLSASEDLVLKAADDVVMVKIGKTKGVDYWVSDMNRVAVVLTPSKPLLPHRQYTLLIDRVLPGYEVLNETGMQTLTWNTGGGAKDIKDAKDARVTGIDKTAPKYQMKPAVAEGFYRKEGDGLTRYLKLNATLAEEAPAYFVVSLKRSRGASNEQKYPVPINGGEANVGHDPCHGSFTFEDGRAYKLTIEAYDSAGNKASDVVKIEAQAPRPGLQ